MDLMKAIATAEAEGTNRYVIEVQFLHHVLGTQPKSKDVMRGWLESKHLDPEIIAKQIAQMPTEEVIADATEAAWTGFFSDGDGIWIGTYQVKAMFRELLSSLGLTVEKRGLKQTHQHLTGIWACDEHGVVPPGECGQRIRFWRDGVQVRKADDHIEVAGHVDTPQGKRSVLKRHDYVKQATIRFLVVVPARMAEARASAVLDDAAIARVLAFAPQDGLGCSRSQGNGQFKVTRFERLTDNPWVSRKAKKKAADEETADGG